MVNSVNTNYGALVALQSLNRTNQELDSVQKRVSTGYRVNDAVDDGAAFAVAQGIRSNVAAIGAVNQQLNIAKGTVATALFVLGMTERFSEIADPRFGLAAGRRFRRRPSRALPFS